MQQNTEMYCDRSLILTLVLSYESDGRLIKMSETTELINDRDKSPLEF